MSKKSSTFALAFKSKVLMHREKGALSAFEKRADDLNFLLRKKIAEIAQLVEHDLAKVGVASSSLVFRSFFLHLMSVSPDGGIGRRVRFRCACREVCRFESCSGHKKKSRAGGEIGIHATLRG